MQQLEIGEEKTIAREEGSQVDIMMMATTIMEMVMILDEKTIAREDSSQRRACR